MNSQGPRPPVMQRRRRTRPGPRGNGGIEKRRGLEVLRAPGVAPEYLALVDEQMRSVARVDARTVVLVAAKVGTTRLIDNVVLGEGVAADPAVRA